MHKKIYNYPYDCIKACNGEKTVPYLAKNSANPDCSSYGCHEKKERKEEDNNHIENNS